MDEHEPGWEQMELITECDTVFFSWAVGGEVKYLSAKVGLSVKLRVFELGFQ